MKRIAESLQAKRVRIAILIGLFRPGEAMRVLSSMEINEVSGAGTRGDVVGGIVGAAAAADLAIAGAELGVFGGPLGAALGAAIGFGLGWTIDNAK